MLLGEIGVREVSRGAEASMTPVISPGIAVDDSSHDRSRRRPVKRGSHWQGMPHLKAWSS